MRRVRRTAITDPTTLEARHGIPILGLRVNPGGGLEPRPVQHSMPQQAEQAASFDRLVNQLTQPTLPAGQSLTPPAPGTVDPFAQPASDR